MQSTRQVHIINGQTALAAELKLALARRAGHDIRPIVRENDRVRVKCLTHDSHEVEWALEARPGVMSDAVIAAEIAVAGKDLVMKTNWQSWGFAMLWARAVSQLCREHCPEAVGGLYSAEELGEGAE
jgi:hypothetical protein